MKIYHHPNEIKDVKFGATIGNFDGIHLGHQAMLGEVKKMCDERKLELVVITFLPHPLQILKAQRGFLISGYEKRRELLKKQGVQHLVEIPFTKDFSATSANDFINTYVNRVSNFELLCLGYDFAFGSNKEGNFKLVSEQLKNTDTEVHSLSEFKNKKESISSTCIRNLIRDGRVSEVEPFLGRKFSLEGKVVHGKGRGKTIGFPTANIQLSEEVIIPATGVYSTTTWIAGLSYRSVTNIGFNPTFSDTMHVSVESHLLGLDEDFYDKNIEVVFHFKIRDEKRFSGVDELTRQIENDIQVALNGKD